MWLEQGYITNCPVCGQSLKRTIGQYSFSSAEKMVCPTYHYLGTLSRGEIVTHTIFLDGDYVIWHPGINKHCELNWNNKIQNIAWLDLESPVDLEALKIRIQKLLWFL